MPNFTKLSSLKKGDTFRFLGDKSCWRFLSFSGEDLTVKGFYGTIHNLCDCHADDMVECFGSDAEGFFKAYELGFTFH